MSSRLPPLPPPRRPARPAWVVPVLSAAAALVVGAGATAVLLGGDDERPVAVPSASPSSSPSASAAPSPSASPTPSPSPSATAVGGEAVLEGAVLTLPAGWVGEGDGAGQLCVSREAGQCELRVLLPDVARARQPEQTFEDPDPDAALGWYLATDTPGCEGGTTTSRLVVRELAPVDDKQANYREWDVVCGAERSRPRLWWLPKTRLAFLDESPDPAVDDVITEIVRTADLSRLQTAG